MKLTVTIDCTTPAFSGGRFDSEVGRVLRRLADRIQDELDGREAHPGEPPYVVADRQGESVCVAEFTGS